MEDNNNENERRGSFLRFLLFIACGLAFIPAMEIPWNKKVWVDDWHFYEESSGFFLRALKILLIAVSVITWLIILYARYRKMIDNNGQDE